MWRGYHRRSDLEKPEGILSSPRSYKPYVPLHSSYMFVLSFLYLNPLCGKTLMVPLATLMTEGAKGTFPLQIVQTCKEFTLIRLHLQVGLGSCIL